MPKIRFLGLDVHADTIAVAVAEPDGEVRCIGVFPNRLESIRKFVNKLGPVNQLRACYEAGPTGYVLYWQLTALGVSCEVIAPTLVPVKAGDKVKTDRRDAQKLARCYRAGDLTAVWVPTPAHEAIRDLVDEGIPTFGICLGHQLLGLASGAKTVKMKFGHHGANHPVLDKDTGHVLITSQNHGFAVDAATLPPTARITHVSLFDGSLQGFARTDRPAFCFQGHPEASPGPHDVAYLFDRFVKMMDRM